MAVWSGHKITPPRDPPNFLRKPLLPVSSAYVFDNRIGEHPIEGTVWKRQGAAVRYFALHVLQPFLFHHLRIQTDNLNYGKMPVDTGEFTMDPRPAADIQQRIATPRPQNIKKKVVLL
jgi:hypothetical protein